MYAESDTCEAVLHIDPTFRKPTQLHNYNLKAKTTQSVLYFRAYRSETCDLHLYHIDIGSACHNKIQEEKAEH